MQLQKQSLVLINTPDIDADDSEHDEILTFVNSLLSILYELQTMSSAVLKSL